MTNAFAPLVGTIAGVTTITENGYLTLDDEDSLLAGVAAAGYSHFEIFEGNIARYADNPEAFHSLMAKHGVSLQGVYIGGNFIYPDALADELAKIDRITALAKSFGASHIVLGGGSLRAAGIGATDHDLLADGLNQATDIVEGHGLTATYHPHLGSLAETPDQIHTLFAKTKINFCPDIAHLQAGGGDALELVKQYRDRIRYVHLKDLSASGEFLPLGKGTLPIVEIVTFLKETGFDGDYCVEVDGYAGDPAEAATTSYDFLKGLLV
ncbi:MAG: sugar phosphate isomerase/epimerase [Cellulomonadaceae bacterium]|jgi:inosose dehydratase|nr:sugar phosphate isomerase/epimerase [Cellulomonadaceae bacterium]